MSKILHLYAGDSALPGKAGSVGLLSEFAPDSPCLRAAEQCYRPEEILGSPDDALPVAYALVSKLLVNTPVIEGLPVLRVLEELMLEQVSYIVQAFHLDRWISSGDFAHCRFNAYSPWLDRLKRVREVTSSGYSLEADVPFMQSRSGARSLRKIWDAKASPSELFRRAMPLWSRSLAAASRRALTRRVPRGGIWFYSTAYNYTKIGLQYEPYLAQKPNFLVEDEGTGGKRLREVGREGHWLYAWSRRSDIPSSAEVRDAARRIEDSVASVELIAEETALRSVLLKSDWWRHLLVRRLPFFLFNNRALQRWREAVRPEMIVVGNAGDERALLLSEGVERVPTVLLQHGIMHWTYGVTDEPVDVFLLRGPFFQRSVNEKFRRKTVVRNLPGANATRAQPVNAERKEILFITTPYDVPELYHPKDRADILRSLLRVAQSMHRRLMIRVHPNETIAEYEQAIADLQRELGLQADVGYSQGPGAEEVLARACVAVLHFSTMFLDCLRHGIPIVSFGWHWFPNKSQFEQENIFQFAPDLRGLESLVLQGMEGKLSIRRGGLAEFMAPSDPKELAEFFQRIWDDRGRGQNGETVLRVSGS